MYNSSTDRYTPPSSANAYCPSVPISVYRELAAELQAAQAMLDSLNTQNQQLVQQNHQLRQEVHKVVQSAQHLQQVVASLGSVEEKTSPEAPRKPEPKPKSNFTPPPPSQPPEATAPPYPETYTIEVEDSRSRHTPSMEGLSDVNGWILIVVIAGIVLTAFGAGFLLVRPLLDNSR
jgi:chromosome segregation ATPase